jgi:hypothetical protein
MMRWLVLVLLAHAAAADPRPALDEFYARTEDRAEGFDGGCTGRCDGRYLAGFLIGAETANPSTDALRPRLASGARLGVDLGVRDETDVLRVKMWADVLRVHDDGTWITDLASQLTAFKAFGAPRAPGVQFSLDAQAARRTELQPADFAELQRDPYTVVDAEAEVAPIGDRFDKDTNWAFPIGVANRLRWDDNATSVERRTAISGAIAFRGFVDGVLHHYQFDALRLKYTDWSVPGGRASSWTVSAGWQRLSPGIDWLHIWLLAGYEWTGARSGPVAQLGAEMRFPTSRGAVAIGPVFEEHLEIDPLTAHFSRVYHGRLYARHELGRLKWGVAYEAVVIDGGELQAVTPEVAVGISGFELGLRYRLAYLRDDRPMGFPPGDRFNVALDWLF